MNTLDIKPGERVKDVHFTEDNLSVDLIDGRTIAVPLAWYPRLLHATAQQRKNWQVCGGGYGIHWPDNAFFYEGIDLIIKSSTLCDR
jgi:hypothetical protein